MALAQLEIAVLARARRRSASGCRTGAGDRSRACRSALRQGAIPRGGGPRRRGRERKSERRSSSIPNSWEVNREAARMLFRHGHIREAIPFFEKAASLMDSDWHSPMMLVTCYRGHGDEAKTARSGADSAREQPNARSARTRPTVTALAAGAYALAMLGDERSSARMDQRAPAARSQTICRCGTIVACTLAHGTWRRRGGASKMLEPYLRTSNQQLPCIRHVGSGSRPRSGPRAPALQGDARVGQAAAGDG